MGSLKNKKSVSFCHRRLPSAGAPHPFPDQVAGACTGLGDGCTALSEGLHCACGAGQPLGLTGRQTPDVAGSSCDSVCSKAELLACVWFQFP